MPEWYEQILELQLRENQDRWAVLEERGLADGAELQLGFVYLGPGQKEAEELTSFLRDETDYEVQARLQRLGEIGEEGWVVLGVTQPVALSLEMIDDWVEWMVAAGAAEGPCAFDGWEVVGARLDAPGK